MAYKAVFVLCAQALCIQLTFSQCLGPALAGRASPFGSAGLGLAGSALSPASAYGPSCGAGVASTGGSFSVTSASPVAPTGVSVVSENMIEGALCLEGNLPLLGSVALEGAFPTAGAGAVSYGCGNGEVGIASESPIATGILTPGPVGPAPGLAAGSIGAAGLGLAGSLGAGLGLAGGPLGAGLGLAGNPVGRGFGVGAINGLGRGIGGPCGAIY